ncbi:MAG: 4-hydroxy-tetrahydrodipicolinate reductase [Gammaproteobacteria bacterium]|jgi:4-hydroxy-tetrahydrodipicolinate reductase|nr:4-hydroxy-tetrahydrodipicolinate reductase [Gammaproteobacteria bacterium]
MLRIALFGATGRMGAANVRQIVAAEDLVLAGAATEAGHASVGRDVGELHGVGALGVTVAADPAVAVAAADVAIDFTLPAALAGNLAACRSAGCPLVLGTTGLSADDEQLLDEISKNIPILYGRNMSIGVNVFTELARQASGYLGVDWDVEISEAHHRFKVDAPSGTALQLGEAVAGGRGQQLAEVAVYARHGHTGPRTAGAIGFSSQRAGSIVGEHTVSFTSMTETVVLEHRAFSREVFASGALQAARWLVEQSPGRYDMRDMLGFARLQ